MRQHKPKQYNYKKIKQIKLNTTINKNKKNNKQKQTEK
jgi:hypothetical protein